MKRVLRGLSETELRPNFVEQKQWSFEPCYAAIQRCKCWVILTEVPLLDSFGWRSSISGIWIELRIGSHERLQDSSY